MSVSTKNQKFKPFLATVMKAIINQILILHNNPKFQKKFDENQTNEDWFLQIQQYLQKNNGSIEEYIKTYESLNLPNTK